MISIYEAMGRNHNVKPSSDWPPDDPMAQSGMVCMRCGLVGADQFVRCWQILLQKLLMARTNSDSVALMRFAAEAGDDGAAESRPRAAVLFIFP
jgi:hypothetical protein